jgi:hypothetical protein
VNHLKQRYLHRFAVQIPQAGKVKSTFFASLLRNFTKVCSNQKVTQKKAIFPTTY